MSIINSGSESIQFWDDVTDNGSGQGSFEFGQSTITQTIRVKFADQVQAIQDILGQHQVIAGALVRTPPLQHSIYPAFYATRCNLVGGYKANGKSVNDVGIGNDVAQFQFVFLQISYNTLPFPVVYTLGHDGDEFYRYLQVIPQFGSEYVKFDVNKTKYIYQSGRLPIFGGPGGLTVPFGQQKVLPRMDLVFRWYNVPGDWVFNSQGYPQKILDGVGRVNSANYQNYPKGTLLMVPPHFEPVSSPRSDMLNNNPNRLWNININVKYFNPPVDPVDIALAGAAVPRGHNLMGYARTGYFYLGQTDQGATLFDSYDYTQIFKQAT